MLKPKKGEGQTKTHVVLDGRTGRCRYEIWTESLSGL
jgi:hypothetical protein